MKKKMVNSILINQTKRRSTVFGLICLIIILFIVSCSFFLVYKERNKDYYVSYNENSNIDYKVFLRENEFFNDEYLEENKQYIATLIDYIDANFEYKLSLEDKDVQYKYTYRVEANVDVKNKGGINSLYNKTEILLDEQEKTSDLQNVAISENVKIDYNYYNNLIKKFASVYELEDIESTLTINMYINVIGSCEDFKENSEKESIISLTIPLTTKTMAIDISDNLINTENNLMLCKKVYTNNHILLLLGILTIIIDLGLIAFTIRYEIKTRTAENIYEKELKKILNNYSSYIQKLNNNFDFKGYQLLKLETFTDMLEIRDTIRQPILMKENHDKTGAYFIIPSNSKILYVYRLKVSDIEKQIKNKQEEEEMYN